MDYKLESIGIETDNSSHLPIEVNLYTKKFKKFLATKDVSFKVGKGVIHGFIGPNGSGKTTTIKALIGAYTSKKGTILINGNIAGSEKANQFIGYIPERASFPKHLNCLQYLVTMGELSGLKRVDSRRRAREILEELDMSKHAKRKPTSFSSGMQKKILLAQSLLTDPDILILDEPAANLDPTARKDLFDQLIKIRNMGKTILISSHILAELERLIDEVTFLYYGQVIYTGKVENIAALENVDIFIKSADNQKLSKFLIKKKYNIKGDLKTEIILKNVNKKKIMNAYEDIYKSKILVTSFRANDLQSIYDALVSKSQDEKLGIQELNNKKTFTTKEDKGGK
jgi:ABC-2 type transport system ATP-binding protein